MNIVQDEWLAEIIGYPAFRVETEIGEGDLTRQLRQHYAKQKFAFYFTKIDTNEIAKVRSLSALGMVVVDTNTIFQLDRTPTLTTPKNNIHIGELQPPDATAVLGIAESAYKFSRFHLDPLFTQELGHKIKHEWCYNYIMKTRGDHLFIARLDNRVAGFLCAMTIQDGNDRKAAIDLIAVATDMQRKGIGEALTRAFIDYYRPSTKSLVVGTQIANIPSMRLYERLGFSISRAAYVMHLHIREGSPI